MTRRAMAILLTLAGVALIGVGLWLTFVSSARTVWPVEKAEEYTSASLALKAVAMRPDRPVRGVDDPELAAAQARFDKIYSELDRATRRRDYRGILLAALGAVFLVAGAAVYLGDAPLRGGVAAGR